MLGPKRQQPRPVTVEAVGILVVLACALLFAFDRITAFLGLPVALRFLGLGRLFLVAPALLHGSFIVFQ